MKQGLTRTFYFNLGHISVACFILAGLTGFLYRLGMIGWVPGNLNLGNIRHAHSHLMFFGWAVPFPMYILLNCLLSNVEKSHEGIRWMKNAIWGTLLFGILAYSCFLVAGYRPVDIGSVPLPLSVMLSGFVMICWYFFIGGYLKVRSLLQDDSLQPWFDEALLMLLICSFGAWSVAIAQAVVPSNYLLMKSLTHFFLAVFTEGWVVLAVLAILIAIHPIKRGHWPVAPRVPLMLIGIGAPLTFSYGISESLLSPLLLTMARLGGLFSAIGLAIVVMALYRSNKGRNTIWLWPILLLALKAGLQGIASGTSSDFWMSDHGLRIFYLHLLLLGALTLTLAGWLQMKFELPNRYYTAILTSVSLTLLSLLLPTKFWPAGWSGFWIFYVLAGAALLPVLAISVQWIRIIFIPKQ